MALHNGEPGSDVRRGVEVDLRSASTSHAADLTAGEASRDAATRPVHASASTPSSADGGAEEVAVCELCGLVSRLPRAPVCPACGGGYG